MKVNKTLTALIAGASLGLSGQAFSADERAEAGTSIMNTAVMTYTVGSVTGNTTDGSISFTVDKRIDVTLTPNKSPFTYDVNPGDDDSTNTNVVMTYKVSNLTNASQEFKFFADNIGNNASSTPLTPTGGTAVSDTFDIKSYTIYTDGDNVFAGGTGATAKVATDLATISGDTLNNPIADTGKEIFIHVVAVIPKLQETTYFYDGGDGFDKDDFVDAVAGLELYARATDGSGTVLLADDRDTANTAAVQVVFTDTDNKVEVYGTYTLKTAYLTVAKAVTPKDNNLGFGTAAHYIPGATATYQVVITNDGSTDATTVVFTDDIATNAPNLDSSTIANITLVDGTDTAIPGANYTVQNDGTDGNPINIDLPTMSQTDVIKVSFDINIK